MSFNKNVKYKEDEYILNDEYNEKESLNKNNEEINDKDLADNEYNFEGNLLKNKEEKKEDSDSNKESHIFEQNILDNNKNDENDKYSKVEDAEEMINLNLVKASYVDGIITLRYKNDILEYVDTMQFAEKYRENLKNRGYEEIYISDTKIIYENEKNQIIIMKEFDYLIIVMVRL